MFEANVTLIAVKFNCLMLEECGPCPLFASYILVFAVQLRKKAREKTTVRVVEKCQLGTIQCVDNTTIYR